MGNEHTRGGVTTRDDAADLGVDMLPGDPDEPQGPEDAFGPGPKRGDYTGRVGDGAHVQIVPNPNAGDGEPNVIRVDQVARASQRGDAAGLKGGVETTDEAETSETSKAPNASDPKGDWVTYAESEHGIDTDGMTKDEIQSAVDEREGR